VVEIYFLEIDNEIEIDVNFTKKVCLNHSS